MSPSPAAMSATMSLTTITPRVALPHARYMGLSGGALRTAIGLTAGLCFLSFGFGQGDIGGLMLVKSFREEFPRIDAVSYPTLDVVNLAGITVSSWNLGCFVGAMVTIFVGDLLGRKGSVMFGLAVMNIGKIIQVCSFDLGQYIAGRVIAGLGNGFIASTVPAWQAECLKTHRRGTLLLVSFGSCITAGVALSYWIDYGFSFVSDDQASWRAPIGLGMLFMILPLMLIIWLPESPRYLVLHGKEDEAKRVLSSLTELSPEDEDIGREFLLIKNTLLHMASGGVGETFRMGQYRYVHRSVLAILLQVMQQFTGVNLFIQYLGSMFFMQLKYLPQRGLLLASCCSTAFFLASLIAVVGIDRLWGRRTLTIFGASGMCVCMIVLAVMAYVDTQHAYYVMTAFLFVYCVFFSIGWQGMSWLWAVELVPLSIRGPANAAATAANWLANFVVVMATPAMFLNITYKTYVVFTVTNFCIVPTIYFFYPETGYRSLEEVDLLFSEASKSKVPWLAVVSEARKEPMWFDENGEYTSSYMTSEEERLSQEKHKHGSEMSDAIRWQQYCKERDMQGSNSSQSTSDDGAAPAPQVATRRVN
ncbi:sugar porter family MFS transporter [Hortaea werneckii]|uniref:Major facilitator superfamily (MFS) profile domain-containing protein n=2 Tax=Hortaea werneckii TaxID=91943 RepID=A0A3M7J2A9_HORWE|nr:sugar porter family MFS transporter [Hortaea werneckii]OTA37415.1 hypothetical protein BTJ68_02232 [Hortaea werneckii EXF-2000]KAI6851402.1 sugar porter family MFS transporter [Hortaea werneckii]KAI6853029.1 sugar porter family MFS transporter [Hortaea werneckii]KAI6944912.1 sugar porter family MFS transporter [Hortaea werneckii]